MKLHIRCFPLFILALAACSSSSSGTTPTGTADAGDSGPVVVPDAAGPVVVATAVLGVGTLVGGDLAASQSRHDQIATGIQDGAQKAGDVGHTVMLGTALLGTHANEFLSLDQWREPKNVDPFYANPDFATALASLLSAPTLVKYVPATGWKQWGTVDSADSADPHYWIVVRGTLKSADAATNQAAHDAVAGNFQGPAQQAGDVGHVVFVGRDDPRLFFAIDVWKDATNIPAFYGSPDLGKALGTVLEGTPQLGVYQSTKWHQW
jgi:quinol monooxygenase YgiN